MSHDIENIIDNPNMYGFEWGYGALHRGPKKDILVHDAAPFMQFSRVARLDLVREHFGDAFVLASLDGTSMKVVGQRLRNIIHANPGMSVRDMQRQILAWAFGMRRAPSARVTVIEKMVNVPVYIANDGAEFGTKLECQQYNMMLAAEANIVDETE